MRGQTEKGRMLRNLICTAVIFLCFGALGARMVSSHGLQASGSMALTGGAAAKFYTGAILASLGGMVGVLLLGWALYIARSADSTGAPRTPDDSDDGRSAQTKRLLFCAAALLAVSVLVLWLGGLYRYGFFMVLFGVFAMGSVCAYLNVTRDTGAERAAAAVSALVVGFLAVGFSGNLADTQHDYLVNGVRFGDAAENVTSKLGLFMLVALLSGALCMGVSRLMLFLTRSYLPQRRGG